MVPELPLQQISASSTTGYLFQLATSYLLSTSRLNEYLILGPVHYSFSPISMIFPNASNMTLKSEKIKVSVSVISRSASRMLRLITLTETLIF